MLLPHYYAQNYAGVMWTTLILSFNCQGLSNLLGLLAVRLSELETALIYNNKVKLILK